MLQGILGSVSAEKVLFYLFCREEGYAREIARFYGVSLRPIQRQLERLESSGVLYSREAGRTRLYALNPRYPFLGELCALLQKGLNFFSESERERLVMNRRRPRLAGKPL
ncbi:MAG: winged helix-turn-helix transcriptional regulator [Planctomycetes bacterium]|nr:winged helix-turn-helix transcriptional regulator [Planctomycetota bacterium]